MLFQSTKRFTLNLVCACSFFCLSYKITSSLVILYFRSFFPSPLSPLFPSFRREAKWQKNKQEKNAFEPLFWQLIRKFKCIYIYIFAQTLLVRSSTKGERNCLTALLFTHDRPIFEKKCCCSIREKNCVFSFTLSWSYRTQIQLSSSYTRKLNRGEGKKNISKTFVALSFLGEF